MKQVITCFLLLWSAIAWTQANTVDLGIYNVPAGSNKFEIRVKPSQNINVNISSFAFTVRFLSSYSLSLLEAESFGPFNFALFPMDQYPSGSEGNYDYYSFSSAAFVPVNWTSGVEVVVAKLYHSNDGISGQGTFELIEDNWTDNNQGNFYIERSNGQDLARNFHQPTASSPLPVELSAFNAALQPDKTVALNWQSQSEVGFSHYSIEHSVNGLNYREISMKNAEGNLQQAANYHFIHTNPTVGKNYYRLRMVDLNGTFEYSPIRSVNLSERGGGFTLSPIPTSGPLILQSSDLDQYPGELNYQLTDAMGKLLEEGVVKGERTAFNLSGYSGGIYFLNLLTEVEQVKQFKIVLTGN